VDLVADLHRPVGRLAFERAGRLPGGGPQQVSAHILARKIVAGRQPCLVQDNGPVGLGDLLATHGNLDAGIGWHDRDLVPSSHVPGNHPAAGTIPAHQTSWPPPAQTRPRPAADRRRVTPHEDKPRRRASQQRHPHSPLTSVATLAA